jgi:hypothetical protein
MSIQPTSSGKPNHAGRLTERPAVERTGRETPANVGSTGAGTDRIELSNAARELAGLDAAQVPGLDLSAERIREIAGRIASGHYDLPEVRDAVVGRLSTSL